MDREQSQNLPTVNNLVSKDGFSVITSKQQGVLIEIVFFQKAREQRGILQPQEFRISRDNSTTH
jgi:hypothetical protein